MYKLSFIQYFLFLFLTWLLIGLSAKAQRPTIHEIHGIVLNRQSGKPLSSVRVSVTNGNQFVYTDDSGRFLIKQALTSTSMFYFHKPGFRDLSVSFNPAKDISFPTIGMLPSEGELDTVAVMSNGYQRLSRERATGSFDFISNRTLNLQTGTDILSRLNGVASGVLFDNKLQNSSGYANGFNIRGLSTIYGATDPLIIVDNFPYEGDINNINPNDVESVTLLKDAAASSIWGAKAGNGVVVITTKRGKAEKTAVSLNVNTRYFAKPDLYYSPAFIRSKDFIDVERMLFDNGFYASTENSTTHRAISPAVEWMIKNRDGKISQAAYRQGIDELSDIDSRQQFGKYLLGHGFNQQYALSFSGGNANHTYYIAGGYDRNKDALDAGYTRYSFHVDENLNLSKGINVGFTVNYAQSATKSGKPDPGSLGMNNNTFSYPYLQLADASGNALAVTRDIRRAFVDTFGGGKLPDWNYYPLEDYKKSYSASHASDALLNLNLTYLPLDGLSFNTQYRYRYYHNKREYLYGEGSYYADNLINTYTQVKTGGSVAYPVPNGAILDFSDGSKEEHAARIQGSYNQSWETVSLNLLGGVEVRQSKTENAGYRTYGYDPSYLTYGKTDFANAYYNNLLGYSTYIPDGKSFSDGLNRFLSYYSNASLEYRHKYILSGSIRKDQSNLFGVNSNEKGVPLWSLGLSWDISKEPFFKSGVLSYLKFRFTYGSSGNIDPGRTALTTIAYIPNALYTNYTYAIINKIANPSLRWEKITMLNGGLDFALEGDVLKGSVDYYHKKGTDLFGNAPLDYTTGLGVRFLTRNVASMYSNGVDVNLNIRLLKGKTDLALFWLGSYNLAKTAYYYNSGLSASNYISNGFTISPRAGMPLYSVVSYKWAGLSAKTGDPQGIVNGMPSTDYTAIANGSKESELVYSGSGMPKFFGSLRPHLKWRNWSMDINLSYKLGYYFRRSGINYTSLFNNGIGHVDFYHRWVSPGDEATTDIPSMTYPANTMRDDFYSKSAVLVEKGDHVRLQFITLSYSVYTHAGDAGKGMSKIDFMLNANNLGILWRANRHHLDPDITDGYLSYPEMKNITFGVRINL